VSKEFLDAIRELHEEGIIESEVTSAYIAAHDSGEFYQLPIAKNVNKIYKKERWLPVLIKKGPNFPKDVKIPLIK
jgi:hypothetical protein